MPEQKTSKKTTLVGLRRESPPWDLRCFQYRIGTLLLEHSDIGPGVHLTTRRWIFASVYVLVHATLYVYVQQHVLPQEAKKYKIKALLRDCLIGYKPKPSKVRPTWLCSRFTRTTGLQSSPDFSNPGGKPLACAAVH